jgi:hypothetical protein
MGDRGERCEADIKQFVSSCETQLRKTKVEAPVSRLGTGLRLKLPLSTPVEGWLSA